MADMGMTVKHKKNLKFDLFLINNKLSKFVTSLFKIDKKNIYSFFKEKKNYIFHFPITKIF